MAAESLLASKERPCARTLQAIRASLLAQRDRQHIVVQPLPCGFNPKL
jgi:hypothetical protein